jgi:hypothetical protein
MSSRAEPNGSATTSKSGSSSMMECLSTPWQMSWQTAFATWDSFVHIEREVVERSSASFELAGSHGFTMPPAGRIPRDGEAR